MTRTTVTLTTKDRHTVTLTPKERAVVEGTWPEFPPWVNVVLILMDDVGPELLDCYDDTNLWTAIDYPDTSWISSIAAKGIVYDFAYASPVCSPTRAQVLTGRYPHQHDDHAGTGIGTVVNAGATVTLESSHYPIPKVLEGVGASRKRVAFGKWHLGAGQLDTESPIEDAGFQLYKGCLTNPNIQNAADYSGGGDYKNYWKTVAQEGETTTQTYSSGVFMGTDEFEDARDWLASQTGPFYLQWFMHSAHASLDAIGDTAGPGTDGYGFGTDDLLVGIDYSGQAPLAEGVMGTPDPEAPCNLLWRRQFAHLEAIDTLAGLLETAIPAALRSKTVFVIMGDNGSDFNAMKPLGDDYWGRAVEPENAYDQYVDGVEVNHFKGTCYEQGIRVPLIIGGDPMPAVTKGTHSQQLVDATDIYPTILDMMTSTTWRSYLTTEGVLDEVDGYSLVTTFGGGNSGREVTFSQTYTPNGSGALGTATSYSFGLTNANRWKLIVTDGVEELYYVGPDTVGQGHTFDADPTEQTNLIAYTQPGSSFNTDVWTEYNEMVQFLWAKIYTASQLADMPEIAYGQRAVSSSEIEIEVTGASIWRIDRGNTGQKEHNTLGNSNANAATVRFEDYTAQEYVFSMWPVTGTGSSTTAVYTDAFSYPINPVLYKHEYVVDGARDADAFAVFLITTTVNTLLRPVIRTYTANVVGVDGFQWEWEGPVGAKEKVIAGRVTDDGSSVVMAWMDQNTLQFATFAWASPVPTYTTKTTLVTSKRHLDISRDGAYALYIQGGGYGGAVGIEVATGNEILTHSASVMVGVSLSADGQEALLAENATIHLYEWGTTTNMTLSWSYSPTSYASVTITHVKLSPDGSTAFVVFRSVPSPNARFHTVMAFDVATGAVQMKRAFYSGTLIERNTSIAIDCSETGDYLLVCFTGGVSSWTIYPQTYWFVRTAGTWGPAEELFELTGSPADHTDGEVADDGSLVLVSANAGSSRETALAAPGAS